MLRMIGAGLLLAAAAAMGFGAAGELKTHVRELEQLILSLESMERELTNRLTPLPELLRRTAEGSGGRVGEFYALCAQALARQEERPFAQLWRQAMEAAGLRLEEDELGTLAELGNVLGRYDAASQSRALEEARARMGQALVRAKEQQSRLGKVYGTLGVTAGAFLVIVLL